MEYKKQPIEELTFSFLDVETTGLSPDNERVCEIAILGYRNFKEVFEFNTLINPQKNIPPVVTQLNGINDDLVKDSPVFSKIIPSVLSLLENTIIVGHNINFDIKFMEAEFKRCGFRFPAIQSIDTYKMVKKLGKFSSNSLGNVARNLAIANDNWHRAKSDVDMTRKVFEHFVVMLRKDGVVTFKDLLKAIE